MVTLYHNHGKAPSIFMNSVLPAPFLPITGFGDHFPDNAAGHYSKCIKTKNSRKRSETPPAAI